MKKIKDVQNIETKSSILLYETKSGGVELRVDTTKETVWATQAEIASVFGVERSVVTKHISNIYKDFELDEDRTCAKIAQVRLEGKRLIERSIENYSLDMILSVGYRISSKQATNFRIWATQTLKQHITKGYTINRYMVSKNMQDFIDAVEETKKLLPKEYAALTAEQTLDLATLFARTWLSLDAYDKELLEIKKPTKKNVFLATEDLQNALDSLKKKLVKKGEATELFAIDRNKNSLEGIIGNVMQSFGGTPVYPSIEEKAAHILYFIVKNHPFVDGNKRSGAFAFVWFLEKSKRLDIGRMSPEALTALTLLVAESNPINKESIVKLIMKLIEK